MNCFVDALGREWTLDLNIATARRVRERCRRVETLKNVDFLDYATLLVSLNDVFFAADLLFVLCEEQAKERDVDAEDFGKSLKGRFLFDATAALTAEYLDFFPDPTAVEKMKTVVAKMNATRETIADAVTSAMDEALEQTASILRKRDQRERGQEIEGTASGERSFGASPTREEASEIMET